MKILEYKSATFAEELKKACESASLPKEAKDAVASVIADVRANGDKAVLAYTKKFDGVEDVNADNDNVLRVAVANGFVSIPFRAAELTLTDLAGRVVAHAVDAAEVASPAAAGVYVLSARTSAGTISAKVYVR